MKRRTAIRTLSIGFGATISASGLATLVSGCQPKNELLSFAPQFLSEIEALNLDELMDIILPKTDTPGAKETDLIQVVDEVLTNVYDSQQQDRFKVGLSRWKMVLESEFDYKFDRVSRPKLEEFMQRTLGDTSKETEIMSLMEKKPTEVSSAEEENYELYQFLRGVKSLAIAGYFSSELVAEEYLSYDPIPGGYTGCIPQSDVGNSWAL